MLGLPASWTPGEDCAPEGGGEADHPEAGEPGEGVGRLLSEALHLGPGQPGGEQLGQLSQQPVRGELVPLHTRRAPGQTE